MHLHINSDMEVKNSLLLLSVFVFVYGIGVVYSAECGQSTIPSSIEVLSTGEVVLKCSESLCFGRPGRATYTSVPGAECSPVFDTLQCPDKNYWVGGINQSPNSTVNSLLVQCCRYSGMGTSIPRGMTIVSAGQAVNGGEVRNQGRTYAFDYINNVVQRIQSNETVSYEVFIRRLRCLPSPPEPTVTVETSAANEFEQAFSANAKARAYQAPISPPIETNRVVLTGELEPIAPNPDNQLPSPCYAQQQPQPEIVAGQPGPTQPEIPPACSPSAVQPGYSSGASNGNGAGTSGNGAGNGYGSYGESSGYGSGGYGSYGGGGGYSGFAAGGGGGGFSCFTADTMVELMNGGRKRMDELSVGDWIATEVDGDVGFSQVKSWIHRMPDELSNFYKIELEDGKLLKLTGKHFIYRTTCMAHDAEIKMESKPIFAENVEVGDCLYVQNEQLQFVATRVNAISVIEEVGIYSPMTYNGKIVYLNVLRNLPVVRWFFHADSDNKLDIPIGVRALVSLFEYVVPMSSFA